MIQRAARGAAAASFAICLLVPFVCLAGRMTFETYRVVFSFASVAWLVFATIAAADPPPDKAAAHNPPGR